VAASTVEPQTVTLTSSAPVSGSGAAKDISPCPGRGHADACAGAGVPPDDARHGRLFALADEPACLIDQQPPAVTG